MDGECGAGILACLFIFLQREAVTEETGLFVACPIATQLKGYPFEVPLPDSLPVGGVILSDQIKSLDWKVRKAKFACKTPPSVYEDVLARLLPLIDE